MAARLKVAILAPPCYRLPPRGYGGTERVCFHLAQGLVDLGHDVELFGAGPSPTRSRYLPTFPEAIGEDRPDQSLRELQHVARVAAVLREHAVDVVHDHTGAGVLAASGAPVVATVHGSLADPGQRNLWKDLSGLADLVAISAAQRRQAPDLGWLGVVHNGIDVDAYPFRAEKQPFLLFLGRISEEKGVLPAIEAAEAAGMPLVIAGAPTVRSERRYLELEVKPRLGNGVSWVGEVGGRRKAGLLADATALLFPIAWDEPFGMVMIEAMACGTPVVALRAGSVDEVLLDGVTGAVCDDVGQLPGGIARASGVDPRACRQHVREHFGLAEMARRYEALYRLVV